MAVGMFLEIIGHKDTLASINLTQGYFNRVSDALNNARQDLQNNDFLYLRYRLASLC